MKQCLTKTGAIIFFILIFVSSYINTSAGNDTLLYYIMNTNDTSTYYKANHVTEKIWELEEIDTVFITHGIISKIDNRFVTIDANDKSYVFECNYSKLSIGDELLVIYTSIDESDASTIHGITRIIII